MDTMRSLLSILLMCLMFKQHSALTCYTCRSTIDKNNNETDSNASYSCAKGTGLGGTATGPWTGCDTRYSFSGGFTSIERGGTPGDGNYCASSISNPLSTICYCNSSDNCNSQAITAPVSYECYSCESSVFFDNGCGSILDTSSPYVQKVQGCSSCFKTLIAAEDHSVVYSRGCTRSIDVVENCVSPLQGQIGKSCACKAPLCNSADTVAIKSVTLYTAVILSAILKLMC